VRAATSAAPLAETPVAPLGPSEPPPPPTDPAISRSRPRIVADLASSARACRVPLGVATPFARGARASSAAMMPRTLAPESQGPRTRTRTRGRKANANARAQSEREREREREREGAKRTRGRKANARAQSEREGAKRTRTPHGLRAIQSEFGTKPEQSVRARTERSVRCQTHSARHKGCLGGFCIGSCTLAARARAARRAPVGPLRQS
jgi:hypothetical protein